MVLASTVKELSVKAAAMGWDAVEAIAVVRAWVEKILTDLKVQYEVLDVKAIESITER